MSDIVTDAVSLEPGNIIELFELDVSTGAGSDSDPIYRWHSGVDAEQETSIVWQGNVYTAMPIEATGFEFNGKGAIPRPTLTVANISPVLRTAINDYDDLIGAKVTRKRTFTKYLDSYCKIDSINYGGYCTGNDTTSTSKSDCLDANKNGGQGTWTAYDQSDCDGDNGRWYLNSTADSDADFADEIWYIDRKATETNTYFEFELTAAHDVMGIKLPSRSIISNNCPWKYKGTECGYSGSSYFDEDNNSVTDVADDVCSKNFQACELRFGENAELPFGGFPGAGVKTGTVR